MSDIPNLHVPPPRVPCNECIEGNRMMVADDTLALVWCPHVRYGAGYVIESGLWRITGPFQSEEAWVRAMMPLFRPYIEAANKRNG